LKYSLAGFGSAIALGAVFFISKPIFHEFNDSFAMKEFKAYGVIGTYRHHYHRFADKVNSLATADSREQHLIRKLASVQKDFELEKVKNTESEVKEQTTKIAERIHAEAGSSIARIPDGIEYEIPTQILPHQLLVLGMEYFRNQDYEKSAVIFHELTHLKEEAGFQKPKNYMISAISWYKLKHYELATDYIKLTQKTAETGSELYRQSLIWQAMLEKAKGNHHQSQEVLTKLISLFPQSEEVKWINQKQRTPASKKEESHE
jgi:hypothetical protein